MTFLLVCIAILAVSTGICAGNWFALAQRLRQRDRYEQTLERLHKDAMIGWGRTALRGLHFVKEVFQVHGFDLSHLDRQIAEQEKLLRENGAQEDDLKP